MDCDCSDVERARDLQLIHKLITTIDVNINHGMSYRNLIATLETLLLKYPEFHEKYKYHLINPAIHAVMALLRVRCLAYDDNVEKLRTLIDAEGYDRVVKWFPEYKYYYGEVK